MVTKTQLNIYNDFLDDMHNNIEKQIFNKKTLRIEDIQNIINNKNDLIDNNKYQQFLEVAFNSNFLDNNKELLKTYIDEYLEKYITTITKNSLIKFFYTKAKKGELSQDEITKIFIYLNLFFRYKWNINYYQKFRELILKQKNKEELNSFILNLLEEYYNKSNVQNNSIFQNQLIKFLKQKKIKDNKIDTLYLSDNYKIDLISFNNIKNQWSLKTEKLWWWGIEYEELKKEIVWELVLQYKRKRNFDYNKFVKDFTSTAYQLGKDKKINVQSNLFSNFITEFKDNLLSKINKII